MKLVIGTGAVLALAAGGVVLVQQASGDPSSTASTSAVHHETAKAEVRTLSHTAEKSGQLGFGDSWTIGPQGSGTLTWLPESGTIIDRGGQIARVDDKPVVALTGVLPLFRELKSGDKGSDVRQLEENLAALGFTGFTVDDKFSATTAKAVRAWQKYLGLEQTGKVDSSWATVISGPVRVADSTTRVGDPASTAAVTVSGTVPLVTASLKTSERSLASEGNAVTVRLPDGTTVPATITKIGAPVAPKDDASGQPSGSDAEATSKVTASIDDPSAIAGLDATTVKVRFLTEEHADVLTVPVKALVATSSAGDYAVEIPSGTGTTLVPVTTGLFDSGYVEVTPKKAGALSAGDDVVVPA